MAASKYIRTMCSKPMSLKTQYVHIDSRARDHEKYSNNNNYVIELPQTYKGVKKVDLLSMQIPNSNFNVAEDNNSFWLYESATGGNTLEAANYELFTRSNFSHTRLFMCTVPPGMHTITTFLDALRYSITNAVCADGTDRKPQWSYTIEHDTTLNRIFVQVAQGIEAHWCAIVLGSLQPVWKVVLHRGCNSTCADDNTSVGSERMFSVVFGSAQSRQITTSLCPATMTPENGQRLAQDVQHAVRSASKECSGVVVEYMASESDTTQTTLLFFTPPRNATIGMPAPQLRGSCSVNTLRYGEHTCTMLHPGYQLNGATVLARPLGAESIVTVIGTRTYLPGIPDLTTERYILLRCEELGEIVQAPDRNRHRITDSHTSRAFSDIFAVVPLPSVAGSLVFQDGTSGKGDDALGSRFFPGPGRANLNKLTLEFVHYDGSRVNFRGLEHSMLLRVTFSDTH